MDIFWLSPKERKARKLIIRYNNEELSQLLTLKTELGEIGFKHERESDHKLPEGRREISFLKRGSAPDNDWTADEKNDFINQVQNILVKHSFQQLSNYRLF